MCRRGHRPSRVVLGNEAAARASVNLCRFFERALNFTHPIEDLKGVSRDYHDGVIAA